MKRWIFLLVFCLCTVFGTEQAQAEGTWIGEEEDRQYLLPDGTPLTDSWLEDQGKWYYLDREGYVKTGIRRIDSRYYYFLEDGKMAVGWIYDPENDKWYFAGDTGELTKGWLYRSGTWYWFDSSCVLYQKGFRMVNGHRYYFYENGRMAGGQYVGLSWYDENGLRDRTFDMRIRGKRRPDKEERDRITKVMGQIPGELMQQFISSGWEFLYYTDKDFFSAPMTDRGIRYVRYQTDPHYKKIKFTDPDAIIPAFGEYLACTVSALDGGNAFQVDYEQYQKNSFLEKTLPEASGCDGPAQFAPIFEAWCLEAVREDMHAVSPDLLTELETALGISRAGKKPEFWELFAEENDGMNLDGKPGPSSDPALRQKENCPIGPGCPVP